MYNDGMGQNPFTFSSVDPQAVFHAIFKPGFILTIGALASVAFVITSIVLLHHWRTHALDAAVMKRVSGMYFIVGFLLLLGMAISGIRVLGL